MGRASGTLASLPSTLSSAVSPSPCSSCDKQGRGGRRRRRKQLKIKVSGGKPTASAGQLEQSPTSPPAPRTPEVFSCEISHNVKIFLSLGSSRFFILTAEIPASCPSPLLSHPKCCVQAHPDKAKNPQNPKAKNPKPAAPALPCCARAMLCWHSVLAKSHFLIMTLGFLSTSSHSHMQARRAPAEPPFLMLGIWDRASQRCLQPLSARWAFLWPRELRGKGAASRAEQSRRSSTLLSASSCCPPKHTGSTLGAHWESPQSPAGCSHLVLFH